MAYAIDNMDFEYQNIRAYMLEQIEKISQENPEYLLKPSYLLEISGSYDSDELKQKLYEESREHFRQRIVLIPYLSEISQYLIILIELQDVDQLVRAEYVGLNSIPTRLQTQLNELYPMMNLKKKDWIQHDDFKVALKLNLQNLLSTMENDRCSMMNNPSISSSSNTWLNEDHSTNLLPDNGNKNEIEELKQGLEIQDSLSTVINNQYSIVNNSSINSSTSTWSNINQSTTQITGKGNENEDLLSSRTCAVENRITECVEKKRTDDVVNERERLRKSQHLQKISDEISQCNVACPSSTDNKQLKHHQFEQQLSSNSANMNLQNKGILPEKIAKAEQEIKNYKDEKMQELSNKSVTLSSNIFISNQDNALHLSYCAQNLSSVGVGENVQQFGVESLESNLDVIPDCAEKTILELLKYFNRKSNDSSLSLQEENIVDKLFDQIKKQELLSGDIQTCLHNLRLALHDGNSSHSIENLQKILRKIRPLNTVEVQKLVLKAKEAAKVIFGKDIVLLIGETGSGKSTTIHFLAGSNMKEIQVEIQPGKYLPHITAVELSKNPGIQNITTSPFHKSETRYIAPVTISLQDVLGNRGVMILCDAPGYSDTAGAEVDLANSVGVLEALIGANSVKLLVLSNYQNLGKRGEGIRKLAYILVNMIKEVDERLDSILYAFTQYPNKININSTLTSIKESEVPNDSSSYPDSTFHEILQDMIDKTEEHTYQIDPINGDRKVLIKKLNRMKGIPNPEKVFQFSMSEETRATIASQIEIDKSNIIIAMKHKNNQLILYYLDDMRILNELTKQSSIQNAYDNSIRYISENISNFCTDRKEKFNRAFNSNDGLQEEDIHEYKSSIEYLQDVQILKTHLGTSLLSPEMLMQNIVLQIKERTNMLENEQEDLYNPFVGIYLNNLSMLISYFTNLEKYYQDSCLVLKQLFDKLVQSAYDLIPQNNFKELSEILLKISKSSNILKNHLDESTGETYFSIIKKFLKHLNSYCEKTDSLLHKPRLSSDDLELLKTYMNILTSAKENTLLKDRISTYIEIVTKRISNSSPYNFNHQISEDSFVDLCTIHQSFVSKIVNYFDAISTRIDDLFKRQKEHALETIHKLIDDMKAIHNIPELESKTIGTYYRTVESINGYMHELQIEAEKAIFSMDHQSEMVNYRHLAQLLLRLKNTEWINYVSPGIYDNLMHRLTEDLVQHAYQLEGSLMKIDCSIKYPQNVLTAYKIVEKIESMSVLENAIPELEKHRTNIIQRFLQSTQAVFDRIQKVFDLQDKEVYGIKQKLKDFEEIEQEFRRLHLALLFLRKSNYSDITVLNNEIEQLNNKQQIDIKQIETEERALDEQLNRLQSIVDEYGRLSTSTSTNITDTVSNLLRHASAQKKTPAEEYLQSFKYSNIDKVYREILETKDIRSNTLRRKEQSNEDFQNALRRLESIKGEYNSLSEKNHSPSHEQMNLLQKQGFDNIESLREAIRNKREMINEREKNEQTYSFNGRIDGSTAESAFVYFTSCEQVSQSRVRENARDANEKLVKYLLEYGKFLDQEIKSKFDLVCQTSSDRNLFHNCQDLSMRLQDLTSLNRYPNVFKCIEENDKIEYWQQIFFDYHHTLTERIRTCATNRKNQELNDQLSIAYALICVDRFCGNTSSTNGFGNLYNHYYTQAITEHRMVHKTVLDYISREDYANAEIALSGIKDSSLNEQDRAQIGHDLQTSLRKLITETKSTANWLIGKIEREEDNRSDIQKIKVNIDKVRVAANKARLQNLLDAQMQDCLKSFDEDINKILSNIISRSHNSIEAFIEMKAFSEAERAMENLRLIQGELVGYCTSENVYRKTDELDDRLNSIVNMILSDNDFTDIRSFSSNPPKDLLEKLIMVPPHVSARFSRAYKQLFEKIQKNFRKAISDAREAPVNESTSKIQALVKALYFLPEDMQMEFKEQLDELGKENAKQGKRRKEEFDTLFKRAQDDENTIFELGVLAKKYKDENLDELFQMLHDSCLTTLRTFKMTAKNSDIQTNIGILRKIFEYKKALGSYIPQIHDIYASVRQSIVKRFISCCEILTNLSLIEQNQSVEQAFSDIINYLKLLEPSVEIVREFFSSSDLDTAKSYIQQMSKYLNENSTNFHVALDSKNIIQLYNTMSISKKWDRLLQNMNKCTLRHELILYLSSEIKTVVSHSCMIAKLEELINHMKSQFTVEFITDETTKFESKRDEFFKNLMSSIEIYQSICSKFSTVLPSLSDVNRSIVDLLKNKVEKLGQQLLSKASKAQLNLKDTDDFRMYYNHLLSFQKHVLISKIDVSSILDKATENIMTKVVALRQEISSSHSDVEHVADLLCQMKFLGENLSMLDTQINSEIDQALKIYKHKQGSFGLTSLTTVLEKTDIGGRIISEHACLRGEDRRKRREKMQKQDNIEYALEELKGDDVTREVLSSCYEIFRGEYKKLMDDNLKCLSRNDAKEPDVQALVDEIKKIVKSYVLTSNTFKWSANFRDQIPKLLAYIFAIWTLQNTENYNDMRGIRSEESYLLMPHVGQIIAIFRLLGIGYESYATLAGYRVPGMTRKSNSLVNNLVELGTGEGKSVVLAITACVFALIGVDVNCSCYSEVLSMRDKDDFTSLFRALKIEERIEYGTFNKLCEQLLNKKCDVRKEIREMIRTNKSTITASKALPHAPPKVLLIDEVDVFLSDKFYGGTYTPSVCLNKESEILALLCLIWKNRDVLKTLRDVKALPAYESCATKYSHWMFLFNEAIKDMLAALQSYQSSTYIVKNDKIVYVEGESIVDNVVRGYNTIWAYFHEHEKGGISRSSLEDNVGIIVNCGTISYAEMPHEFSYIAGVTGTLKTLARMERDILEKVYHVEKMTYIPSVYGRTNRTYDSRNDVRIVKQDEYFMEICREMENVRTAHRAILIFFESEDKLMEFYNSSNLSDTKENVQIITEKVSVKDRELYIKRAAVERQVTLITRTFGRGTDFICRNQQLLLNGGIHVLQTFFSEELSEEYQIMGRGARQGDRGSYRMILLAKDLEWVLGATWREELDKARSISLYEVLNNARKVRYESKCSAKHHGIEQRKKEHIASKSFMSELSSGDMTKIHSFLTEQNKGADLSANSSRTILLMDATGSMSGLLTAAKETVCIMFERATEVLKMQKTSNDSFQMQMTVYRDYDCMKDSLLQSSSWESKPMNLRSFIEKIAAEGGGDYPEAIEIGLWHAFEQSELLEGVSQIILIGDAPAKSEEAIKVDRTRYGGEVYWSKTIYKTPTHYAKELQKLKKKNIPVHTFYLHDGARENFEEIARETGGHCKSLNIHSTEGAELLTHFVTEEVLRKTGGEAAAQLYKEMFVKKSFTS